MQELEDFPASAAAGPSGMTAEHLRVLLHCPVDTVAFIEVATALARVDSASQAQWGYPSRPHFEACHMEDGAELLPFVSSFYGRPSTYLWGRDRLWPIPFWPSWFRPGQFWPIQFWPIQF